MRLAVFKSTILLTLLLGFSCGSGTKGEAQAQDEGLKYEAQSTKTEVGKENKDQRIKRKDTTYSNAKDDSREEITELKEIVVGANRISAYFPLLKGKNIGIVANQTSRIYQPVKKEITKQSTEIFRDIHLVDYLFENKIAIQRVFAPEHGFRGTADAGEAIKDGIDSKTKLPIISLYGKNKKPSPEQLEGLDVVVFDIQDVGARFYTYISTLHYVMEACAEAGILVMVLDRPNPNGYYIDGPILEPEHSSFVGMHPVPVVHGMTIGEYAKMINGQGWLKGGIKADLTVIPIKNYSRTMAYSLPIKPSPNLPNDVAINLYPSLCFFEGTIVSAGRGTDQQFQIFGAPSLPSEFFPYTFTPQSNEGAKYPKFKGELCNGLDLSKTEKLNKLNLEWLVEAYVGFGKKPEFFTSFFTKLAGTKKLQEQIEKGYTYFEIRKTWIRPLEAYNKMRQPYLLYQ